MQAPQDGPGAPAEGAREGAQTKEKQIEDYELAVGAVVFDPGGRVLLIRRRHPPLSGTWTLPGGRIQPGESLSEAVTREVAEETGVRGRVVAEMGRVLLEAEGRRYAIHEFLLSTADQAVRAGDDAAEARWVSANEIATLGVTVPVQRLIETGRARMRQR